METSSAASSIDKGTATRTPNSWTQSNKEGELHDSTKRERRWLAFARVFSFPLSSQFFSQSLFHHHHHHHHVCKTGNPSKTMPTFTTIALERLLEPNLDRNTSSFRLKQQQINTNNNNNNTKKPPKHIFISPALYTTPDPAPIPYTSTDSCSPSPYVVNRKRRDLPVPEAVNRLDGFEIRQLPPTPTPTGGEKDLGGNGDSSTLAIPIDNEVDESCPVVVPSFLEEEACGDEGSSGVEIIDREGFDGNDLVERNPSDFFAPRDSMSVTSCSEVDGSRHAYGKQLSQISTQTEFFDADEEFFSDGSMSNASPSPITSIMELRAARVKLFEEIERRKRAEETVAWMQNQWQRVTKHLSQVGLSFPAALDAGYDTQVEQFCQEVIVARFVSDAIGRGLARAEIEEAAEALIESKNLEISRLRDKLQYYETVNHEMFQRNQEVVELARMQRSRRKTKQRWIWSCIGLSITLGASVLAYSYLPEVSTHSSMNSTDAPDVPSGPTESTIIGG